MTVFTTILALLVTFTIGLTVGIRIAEPTIYYIMNAAWKKHKYKNDFPKCPITGQQYTIDTVDYMFNGTDWIATVKDSKE